MSLVAQMALLNGLDLLVLSLGLLSLSRLVLLSGLVLGGESLGGGLVDGSGSGLGLDLLRDLDVLLFLGHFE